MIGDGVAINIERTTKNFSRHLFQKLLSMKVLTFLIFPHLLCMEWVTTVSREEVTLISGQFGRAVLNSNHIFKTSVVLTVNSVLRVFLFGKPSSKLLIQTHLMNLLQCFFMKDTTVALVP